MSSLAKIGEYSSSHLLGSQNLSEELNYSWLKKICTSAAKQCFFFRAERIHLVAGTEDEADAILENVDAILTADR